MSSQRADLRAFVERPRDEVATLKAAAHATSRESRWQACQEVATLMRPEVVSRDADLLHHVVLAARIGALNNDDRRRAR